MPPQALEPVATAPVEPVEPVAPRALELVEARALEPVATVPVELVARDLVPAESKVARESPCSKEAQQAARLRVRQFWDEPTEPGAIVRRSVVAYAQRAVELVSLQARASSVLAVR